MQKKKSLIRFYFLNYLLLIISIFNFNCKLNLNNPGDPFSKAFLETFLLRAYLDSLCDPNVRGSFTLGSGSQMIWPINLKVLKSGNIAVSAISEEPLNWNGTTNGINANHTNTGFNGLVFVIDKNFSRILWLDYFGEMTFGVPDWPNQDYISISEYSNGDIGVFSAVDGAGRSGSTNAKTGSIAFFAGRYKQNSGSIVWFGYLNKDNTRFKTDFLGMNIDESDQMVLYYQSRAENITPTTDTTGLSFPGLPLPAVGTNATIPGQTELGVAILDSNGIGVKQSFLPNPSSQTKAIFLEPFNGKYLIGGTTSNNFPSFSGHPFIGDEKMYYGVLNSSFFFESVGYYGSSLSTESASMQKHLFSNNEIYFAGKFQGPQSSPSPIHPFQGTSIRNYGFIKANILNTTPIWIQYLGASSGNIPDVFPTNISYIQSKNHIFANILAKDNGDPFTGLPSNIVAGSATNPLPQAKINLLLTTGEFTRLSYFEGSDNSSGDNARYTAVQREACSGRLVSLESQIPLLGNTSARRMRISTRPAMEEP